jgi:hypothetical protein
MKLTILLTALALAIFTLPAQIHAADKKGKDPAPKTEPQHLPLTGTVETINSRTLTLKAAEGKDPRKFTITKDTVIERGHTAVKPADIKPGTEVTGSFLRTAEGDTLTRLNLKDNPPSKKPADPKKPAPKK